jgi:hypothetical protein
MNKNWLIIVISIFITVLLWSGLEVYSCFGGMSPNLFGVALPICKYTSEETLLNTQVTPIPQNLSIEAIEKIKEEDTLVIIKDKSEL